MSRNGGYHDFVANAVEAAEEQVAITAVAEKIALEHAHTVCQDAFQEANTAHVAAVAAIQNLSAAKHSAKSYTPAIQLLDRTKTTATPVGFRKQLVPGDGNCFYHAVLVSLKDTDPNYVAAHRLDASKIRQEVAREIRAQPAKYGSGVLDPNDNTPTCWAGHPEIIATQRVLHRPIRIWDSSRGRDQQGTFLDEVVGAAPAVYVVYNGRNHYDALVALK